MSKFLSPYHWLHATAQELSECPINRAVCGLALVSRAPEILNNLLADNLGEQQ